MDSSAPEMISDGISALTKTETSLVLEVLVIYCSCMYFPIYLVDIKEEEDKLTGEVDTAEF